VRVIVEDVSRNIRGILGCTRRQSGGFTLHRGGSVPQDNIILKPNLRTATRRTDNHVEKITPIEPDVTVVDITTEDVTDDPPRMSEDGSKGAASFQNSSVRKSFRLRTPPNGLTLLASSCCTFSKIFLENLVLINI